MGKVISKYYLLFVLLLFVGCASRPYIAIGNSTDAIRFVLKVDEKS